MLRCGFLYIFLLFVLFGCGNPELDATTEQMLKISYNKVLQSVPEDKRRYFDDLAILYIQPYEYGGHEERNIIENLHGMKKSRGQST